MWLLPVTAEVYGLAPEELLLGASPCGGPGPASLALPQPTQIKNYLTALSSGFPAAPSPSLKGQLGGRGRARAWAGVPYLTAFPPGPGVAPGVCAGQLVWKGLNYHPALLEDSWEASNLPSLAGPDVHWHQFCLQRFLALENVGKKKNFYSGNFNVKN